MKAITAEFPFVEELPKREKGKLVKLWDQVKEMTAIAEDHGMLLPVGIVAQLLDVSRQRVYQLIESETLETFEFHGQTFVTENSIVAWCKTERKAGRPVGVPSTMGECVKRARRATVEARDSKKKA